jgi:hypothetical protein
VQRFLARQPIFNPALIAYGCDLLFGSGPENRHDFLHEDMASASTADNIPLFGTAGSTTCAADTVIARYFTSAAACSFASSTTSRATSSGSIAVLSTTTASAARTSGEVDRCKSRRSRS